MPKSKGKTCMVKEPSLNHIIKIGLMSPALQKDQVTSPPSAKTGWLQVLSQLIILFSVWEAANLTVLADGGWLLHSTEQ
jgi:hypothetical protein